MSAYHTTPIPRRIPRAIKWLVGIVVSLAVLLILTAVVSGLVAKSALDDAKSDLTSLPKTLQEKPATTLGSVYDRLAGRTNRAAVLTDLPTWRMFEWVPVVGKNMAVFRETATVLNNLVQDGAEPVAEQLHNVSFDSLKPVDGKINIAPFTHLSAASQRLNAAVIRARDASGAIDTTGTIGQLADAVKALHHGLVRAQPYTSRFTEIAPLVGPVMGVDKPRKYLILFQNPAEERASGGNPGVLGYLSVSDGQIELEKVAAASEGFPHPYKAPVLDDYSENWQRLFGNHITTYISNVTWMPNLDDTAALAIKMWGLQYPKYKQVDGVISFDPVALSYLLRATGPITLASGDVIDSKNAVAFLLSDIYTKYPDPAQEDLIFNSAASTIFTAVSSLKGDLGEYLNALGPMVEEGRLKMWSADPAEEAQLLDSPLSGILPETNTDETRLGVYFNDDATSKMSYYVNASALVTVNQCQADPVYSVSTTVVNTITDQEAAVLPEYVAAHMDGLSKGQDRLFVMIYGPVDAKFDSITVNGKTIKGNSDKGYPYEPKVVGTDRGRPVVIVRVTLNPLEASTIVANFTGHAADSENVTVSHTPKVRKMPIDYETAVCS